MQGEVGVTNGACDGLLLGQLGRDKGAAGVVVDANVSTDVVSIALDEKVDPVSSGKSTSVVRYGAAGLGHARLACIYLD